MVSLAVVLGSLFPIVTALLAFKILHERLHKVQYIGNIYQLPYDKNEEVEKFVWADYIIYHTPIWWFQLPNGLKKYIDEVFTAGHAKGIYMSDGRNAENPEINYGTGGMLGGRKYMLTTSWNAPATAFTLPGEFFSEKSVDDGPLFGFHRMNAFVSLEKMESFHFHDVEKNANIERDMKLYRDHVRNVFEKELKPELVS